MDALESMRTSDRLTSNEREIAAYILAHPEEVSRMSSRELARRTYTSATAIARLSKKLGFANFNELKVNIVSDLKRVQTPNTDLRAGEDIALTVARIATLERRIVDETERRLSYEAIARAAEMVSRATHLDLLAFGPSATMADYAAHNFLRTGKIPTLHNEVDRITYLSLTARPDHVALIVSRGGEDQRLVEAQRNLRQRGVGSIVMTCTPQSTLARGADVCLEGIFEDVFEKVGDVTFLMSCKYLFDVLLAVVVARNYDESYRLERQWAKIYHERLDVNVPQ